MNDLRFIAATSRVVPDAREIAPVLATVVAKETFGHCGGRTGSEQIPADHCGGEWTAEKDD